MNIQLSKIPYKKIREIYNTYFTAKGLSKSILSDKYYVPQYYQIRMKKEMNINNPVLFSEKLNWLKIYYHDPLYTILADKYKNRFYIKKVLDENLSVPLLGVWDKFEDIDFDKLPNQFVLKTNHDGGPILCLDKNKFDINKYKEIINNKLKNNKYKYGREWSYKNIKRRIIAEELLGDGKTELIDYKFFCFNGEVKFLNIFTNSVDGKHGTLDYLDMNFQLMPFRHKTKAGNNTKLIIPVNFDKMIEISQKLSSWCNIPFVRVDMYNINGKIYVGELTFYPKSGMVDLFPDEWNKIVGDWLVLPKKNQWKEYKKRDNEWIEKTLML